MNDPWAGLAEEIASDARANGHRPPAEPPASDAALDGVRRVRLTEASTIKVRPVRWLWEGRLPLGAISLLGGREGIGKSTCAYTLVAQITTGSLPGAFYGQQRAVLIASTEDSWSQTIVPRLMAAGADLGRVYQVNVLTTEGAEAELTLPVDIPSLQERAREVGAVLLLLDPLLSRLSAALDSHKDAEVRRALEPLGRLAESADMAVLGLIHVNKRGSSDPLSILMASRAFTAVSRAVLFAMRDPEEDGYLLGQPKNNLGRLDLPTLTYRIEEAWVADTDEGPVTTGKIVWTGEVDRSVQDALAAANRGEDRSALEEATDWLSEHMSVKGGADQSHKIKSAAKAAGISSRTLQRSRDRLNIETESVGFPRCTYWLMPGVDLPEVS